MAVFTKQQKKSAMHIERTNRSIEGRRALLLRMLAHNSDSLPKHVDLKKLEAAYRALEGYALVLKRKA